VNASFFGTGQDDLGVDLGSAVIRVKFLREFRILGKDLLFGLRNFLGLSRKPVDRIGQVHLDSCFRGDFGATGAEAECNRDSDESEDHGDPCPEPC